MVTIELDEAAKDDEFQQLMAHIKNGKNFLLSGGAGSGKTYTLVQVIKRVIEENPTSKIACITYTNAAVKEIDERVNHNNLSVSTIHDFLWDTIKHYQKELKLSLIDLANDESIARIKIDGVNPVPKNFFDSLEVGIQYKEYLRIKEGIISHDELLLLANCMFRDYVKLCDIVKDKYSYIFVDEYQDTQEEVIKILLEHLNQSKKSNLIGFFGDAMQCIYDNGIGDIEDYKAEVTEVKKEQNRRNPKRIIDLANKLRTDGLIQRPSQDRDAPNVQDDGKIKNGNIEFYYSTDNDLQKLKEHLKWDFGNSKKTKELNLTHNLIAEKAGFKTLMGIYDNDRILAYKDRIKKYIKDNQIEKDFSEYTFGETIHFLCYGKTGADLKKTQPTKAMQTFISENSDLFENAKTFKYSKILKIYVNKDQLLDDKKQDVDDEAKKGSKRDDLIKHLFKIQNNILLYITGQYNEFLKVTDFSINSIQQKRELKESIESLVSVENKTIEEVAEEADEKGICKIDDRFIRFKIEKEYIYNRVKLVPFKEFQKLYNYLEGHTPFSTQHKTKGAEFDNVLVVLDNGNWNFYNFTNLFTGTGNENVLRRSQKIFYVCCTRTKENLAVYFNNPSNQVIEKAKEWFGDTNVINLNNIN